MALSDDRSADTCIIDEAGDVIIILKNPSSSFAPLHTEPGQDTPVTPEVRFQVSAADLICSSGYFKNMFSSNWKESAEFKGKGTVEIMAEGWDTNAFEFLMHCFYNVPRGIAQGCSQPPPLSEAVTSWEAAGNIAVVAEYYQCLELVRWVYPEPTIAVPLSAAPGETEYRLRMARLWTCWVLSWPEHFRIYSANIIETAKGCISPLGLLLPDHVIGKSHRWPSTFDLNELNRRRIHTLQKMVARIRKHYKTFLRSEPGCTYEPCRHMMLGGVVDFMEKNKIWRCTTEYTGISIEGLKLAGRSFRQWQKATSMIGSIPPCSFNTRMHDLKDDSLRELLPRIRVPTTPAILPGGSLLHAIVEGLNTALDVSRYRC
ncbi:hypothetical protein BDW75DRAFT_237903 [Aspergillus navahoensis]